MNPNKKKRSLFTKRTLSNLIVVAAGVLLYLFFSNITAMRSTFSWFFGVFKPFIIAIGLAYLLNIPARFLEERLFKKLRYKKALSIAVAYLFAAILVLVLLLLILPQILNSLESLLNLARNVQPYLNNLGNLVANLAQNFGINPQELQSLTVPYADLVNTLANWIMTALPNLLSVTMQIGSGVITALTAVIASIYMLLSKDKLLRQVKRVLFAFFPIAKVRRFIDICSLSNGVFSGFISGKLLDSAIIGSICFVFMLIVKMPYAVLISIIIGITNIIPFFGPFIGAVPSVMILLLIDPWAALWFTVFIIILQQFDGNILGPKILGDSTGLPALWVLISIVVGGGLFGFAGMLLGVPTAAVLYTLSSTIVSDKLKRKGIDEKGELVEKPPLKEPIDEQKDES